MCKLRRLALFQLQFRFFLSFYLNIMHVLIIRITESYNTHIIKKMLFLHKSIEYFFRHALETSKIICRMLSSLEKDNANVYSKNAC